MASETTNGAVTGIAILLVVLAARRARRSYRGYWSMQTDLAFDRGHRAGYYAGRDAALDETLEAVRQVRRDIIKPAAVAELA